MFLDLYNKTSKAEATKFANEFFIKKLLGDKVNGNEKAMEITAMDMENKLGTEPIPSMFYTFMYVSEQIETLGQYKFYDVIPLIFCTGNDGKFVDGINFNLIPNSARASILDTIIQTNKSFYENDVFNGEPINKGLANSLIEKKSRNFIINKFSTDTKLDISKACRRYKREYMQNIRMIEYDMWKNIPFLTFTENVRGASLAKLQAEIVPNNK